jgi:Tol biopolymer transport system component
LDLENKRVNIRFNKIILILFLVFISLNCEEDTLLPDAYSIQRTLCYMKEIDDNWELVMNNFWGTNQKNISNNEKEDSEPEWSPDGRYIVYKCFTSLSHTDIYLYDTEDDCLMDISSDDVDETSPIWVPDGSKIIYIYNNMSDPYCTYIMDKNGKNKKLLFEYAVNIYFLNDNYSFIYQKSLTSDNEIYFVYKSNIDGTKNEFLFDRRNIGENYVSIKDINVKTNDILFTMTSKSGYSNVIATYNIQDQEIDTLSIAEEGWVYLRPIYSHDSKTIAFIERNYDEDISNLILFENGLKKELVKITSSEGWFDYNSLAFSPNDKYIAYSKNIYLDNGSVSWNSYLYIVNIETKENLYIDMGKRPVWNPKYYR